MGMLTGCHRRTVLKYTLLQLPGIALLILVLLILDHWLSIPPSWFWGILFLWLLKEIILFPLTWRSYQSESGHNHNLLGATGRVIAQLNPDGTVEIQGELWDAECAESETLDVGTEVRVIARSGLILQVARNRQRHDTD